MTVKLIGDKVLEYICRIRLLLIQWADFHCSESDIFYKTVIISLAEETWHTAMLCGLTIFFYNFP